VHCSRYLALCLLWALLLFPVAEAAGRVESVAVTAQAAPDTAPPPEKIAQRMAASVRTIADHVLIGKAISDIETGQRSYERLVQEVFDRILIGYSVEQVQIVPGEQTRITIMVRPWGEVVRSVQVEMGYGGLSPDVITLVDADLTGLAARVEALLIGLPVDAMDWAGGAAKAVVRERLDSSLPEFRASIEVQPGADTVVYINLAPAGAVIQDVSAVVHSRTIPNFLLLDARTAVEEAAKSLNGLPVGFVERHREYFSRKVNDAAAKQRFLQRYGIRIQSTVFSAVHSEVEVQANTDKYRIWVEGYMDIARAKDNTSARLHGGKRLTPRDELFAEVEFIPGPVAWQVSPGFGHAIGSRLTVGAKYAVRQREETLWLTYGIDEKWSLRLERRPKVTGNEAAVRYRFREFLSAEYVLSEKDRYLRLIANL